MKRMFAPEWVCKKCPKKKKKKKNENQQLINYNMETEKSFRQPETDFSQFNMYQNNNKKMIKL